MARFRKIDLGMSGSPYAWDESTLEREVKPLIETKFEVRKTVYGRLPGFVTALAHHFAIDPWKLSDPDDLPF
jgi:hypothetical protein